jgi:hypothetical protein
VTSRRTICFIIGPFGKSAVAISDIRSAANWRLFDHRVGNGEQPWRKGNAECSGGVEVDDQLELGRCSTGMSAGFSPFRTRPA